MEAITIKPYITRWDVQRLNYLTEHGIKTLRYKTGSFSFALIRLVCLHHDISMECVKGIRINDKADHWALIIRNDVKLKTFNDIPILS